MSKSSVPCKNLCCHEGDSGQSGLLIEYTIIPNYHEVRISTISSIDHHQTVNTSEDIIKIAFTSK